MRKPPLPASSLAFDWTMAALAALIMAGVIQDGWAHAHGLVDQSFFTPWHAILYSCMAISGIVLATAGVGNLLRGYRLTNGLPYGYWTSAIGVLLFLTGGVFDLLWHTLFGIETDITGLISISHLWLALGGALVFAGPIRSIAHRYDASAGGWKIAGPLLLCAAALLTLLGFFTQYASLFGDNTSEEVMSADRTVTGGELFSVRTDGTRETRLLTLPKHDIWGAAASPDGRFIAYRVQSGATAAGLAPSDIYVARADGTHAVRITHSGRHDTQVAWSPDGKRLAYVSMPAGTSGNFRIVTIDAEGRNARAILDGTTTVQNPSWSPNGSAILFQSRNGLHQQLAVISANGGAARWLPATTDGNEPFWGRSGSIVYDNNAGSLLLTSASGAKATTLSFTGSEPALSPDGKRIAYAHRANGATQIYVARIDGSGALDATQLAAQDASHPAWRSNTELIFTAAGRPQGIYTSMGLTYSIDAVIITSLITVGIMLMLVRRWRMPLGAMTVLLGLSAIALSTQADTYWDIPAALACGIVADISIALLGDRIRSGNGLYAFGCIVPLAMTAFYIAAVRVHDGALGWPPNMIFGAPFIAGFAGLLLSFCFSLPLPQAASAVEPIADRAQVSTLVDRPAPSV